MIPADDATDSLRDLYQDLILDHGRSPRHFHVLADANREATGHNPLCGDRLILFLKVDADDVIRDAAFQGTGCAISIASASMLTEMLRGRPVAEARRLFAHFHAACAGEAPEGAPGAPLSEDDAARLQALAGVRQYPMRVKCATLAWHTLNAALDGKSAARTETPRDA